MMRLLCLSNVASWERKKGRHLGAVQMMVPFVDDFVFEALMVPIHVVANLTG